MSMVLNEALHGRLSHSLGMSSGLGLRELFYPWPIYQWAEPAPPRPSRENEQAGPTRSREPIGQIDYKIKNDQEFLE